MSKVFSSNSKKWEDVAYLMKGMEIRRRQVKVKELVIGIETKEGHYVNWLIEL